MPSIAFAQEDSVSYRREIRDHRVSVDYRVNSTTIDPNYRKNNTVISRVDSIFKTLKQDTAIVIEAVEFSGSASPEGNLQINRRLSRARMLEMEKFVRKHISFDDAIVLYNDRIVDWNHLIELVEADTTLAMRDEVLRISRGSYPDVKDYRGLPVDGRIPEIKRLDNGKTWSELLKRYFVKMRTGTVTLRTYVDIPVIIERPKPEPVPVQEPAQELVEQPAEVVAESIESTDEAQIVDEVQTPKEAPAVVSDVEPDMTSVMSVKTNLLAYSTLIPNLGVEFRIADHWSAEVTAMYSPFDLFRYNRKTRVLAAKPEVRYWFSEAMRKGHFIGVHIPIAGFNIQLEDNYRYQDPRRALWGVGLNYGYALLLGKEQKWALDFTIGLGYMDVSYNLYEGVRNGKYIRTERKHYFGPTRIGVNLSYLINKKRDN